MAAGELWLPWCCLWSPPFSSELASAFTGTGTQVAAHFPRAIKIRAIHNGNEYTARLRTNGTVRFKGKATTASAMPLAAACGRPINGAWFWRFEKSPGNWQRLRTLR